MESVGENVSCEDSQLQDVQTQTQRDFQNAQHSSISPGLEKTNSG